MNRSLKFRKWIPFAVSILYIILFAYATISKFLDFENFKIQLGQSPMLTNFAEVIAYGVPTLELLLAIALSIHKFRTLALYVSLGLMTAFSMYIAAILNLSDFVPCSCGGILEDLGWTEHLIFNLIFVLLGCIAIILSSQDQKTDANSNNTSPKRHPLIKISSIVLLCSSLVLGLFSNTNYKNHLPGSFIRLFPPHPISEIKAKISLTKDEFQFAGITKNNIYLHKKGNPLELLQLDYNLSKADTILLKVPKPYQLKHNRTAIAINDLGVFITDGAKPILLKGSTNNWKLKAVDLKNNHFNSATVIDTNLLAVTKLIPQKGRLLGLLNTNVLTIDLNPLALKKQVDGFFCTDGFLHYNPELQKLIYTYYYRNEYILLDKNLKVAARYNTIDTTTTAQIKIREAASKEQRSMATPPPVVNSRGSSQQYWLFNQSRIRAKNESEKQFNQGKVIDVYHLKKGMYKHSFYIPNLEGQSLKDFRIAHDQLLVLYPDRIARYALGKNYLGLL
ncbi:MauE/DoxX family redox-associated membrane protein [Wocania ichthyoenteri]|uniref:MauE/DoxX family redox-associated membrane protein n=1 Tax=Wocania ichthyoenteri TaxID=1230531 RepID=UPI00053F0A98|nr:MauE/DoxX family redox-associated membrane protein [Wocania ichthyoenteri]